MSVLHLEKLFAASLPKRGEDDGADAYGFTENSFALADGVTRSFCPHFFSRALTETGRQEEDFSGERIDERIEESIGLARRVWLEKTRALTANAAFPAKIIMRQSLGNRYPAASTLLRGSLDARKGVLHLRYIGDTVLFHFRERELIDHFPAMAAEDFDNYPEAIYSYASEETGKTTLRKERIAVVAGDIFAAATDAAAELILRAVEADGAERLSGRLVKLDNQRFGRSVDLLRRLDLLNDDDTTLLLMRVTERRAP